MVVLRCWLRAHADAITAVSLGASTSAVTVVDPPWSLPGVVVSTGWLCVVLHRRRSRRWDRARAQPTHQSSTSISGPTILPIG